MLISFCFYKKKTDCISEMETTPVVSKIKIHVSMKEKQINAEKDLETVKNKPRLAETQASRHKL